MKQILTSNGMNLILRGLTGSTIEFTKIKFGNGEEQGATAVDLGNPIMEVLISSITRDNNFITLGASYKNADVPTEFSAHEIGVFAKDPDDNTKEILYCFWYEEDPVKADYISPVEDRILETKVEFLVFVDTVENVTAVIAGTTDYATRVEFENHTGDTNNPHKVDKDDVGLGNVPNVTPENQQPTFDTTILAPGEANGKWVLPTFSSGEKMGSILQRVRSVIWAVADHFNKRNPHGMTAGDIDAASKTHYHSALDINKGILGIPRGGTGGGTPLTARQSLGIQSGTGTITFEAGTPMTKSFYFSSPFNTAPKVVITPISQLEFTDLALSVRSVTLKSFQVQCLSDTVAATIDFNWIAIE